MVLENLLTAQAAPRDGFLLSAWVSHAGPLHHEALLRGGFEGITFDMQHGTITLADVGEGILRATFFERPAFVRVAVDDLISAARCLDLGAAGVILPMIESAEDAARFVAAIKYPPLGQRSFGPTRAAQVHRLSPMDYFDAGNRGTMGLAMIETAGAYEGLDAILAVEGLDGVFVGPSDLSLALGAPRPEPTNAATEAAVQAIAKAAKGAGRVCAVYALNVEDARRYRGYGYEIVCVSSDTQLLQNAAQEACRAVRG